MSTSSGIGYTVFRFAAVLAAVLGLSVSAAPPRYAVEPILNTLSVDQTAAFAARWRFRVSGAPSDLAAYARASKGLRADVEALGGLRGHGEEVRRLGQARATAETVLAMMETEISRRRHA